MNLFDDFAVGDQVTAVAAFPDGERRQAVIVASVDRSGLLVRGASGEYQRFDLSGAYYCQRTGQKTAWLEKAA